jgi:hypothetical protein
VENNMAKYKCLLSGNVIEFTHQVDIDSMVGHSGYELLVEELPKEVVVKTTVAKKTVAKAATQVEEQ